MVGDGVVSSVPVSAVVLIVVGVIVTPTVNIVGICVDELELEVEGADVVIDGELDDGMERVGRNGKVRMVG